MSRRALIGVALAAALTALCVAGQRIGVALTLALLATIAAGALAAGRRPAPVPLMLTIGLALQPTLRDAGWVVGPACAGSLVAAAVALGRPATWWATCAALVAPLRVVAGGRLVGGAGRAALPRPDGDRAGALVRGGLLAGVLLSVFVPLFVAADPAFAELTGAAFDVDVDTGGVLWRLVLAATAAAVAGALALAARPVRPAPTGALPLPGRVELRVGLGVLVAAFLLFVAVQVRVLFGGAAYVERTTGLGYGDYARQGFVALVVVATLVLAVVAATARERDRGVRALLGALCGLTLVVLASALHRLGLVEDAYGLTRVRYGGHALVLWLAAVLVLVLAAAHPRVARLLPRVVDLGTLAALLAFALSDPDARIAHAGVDRAQRTGTADVAFLSGLSADAAPALRELPDATRAAVLAPLDERLRRADGWAGANVARARARR